MWDSLNAEEYAQNYFEVKMLAQMDNWKKLHKWQADHNNNMPDSWPGPKEDVNRPLVTEGRWTCWSIRKTDLGVKDKTDEDG
jgi:hypothetical protein